jgi:phospholipid-translocating ATPase
MTIEEILRVARLAGFSQNGSQMCTRPVLHCPGEEGQFILQTDMSGAVLSQDVANGEDRPIAFFSRKLLPRETRYSNVEKKCLALVVAIKHFDVHLVGHHFKNHRALQYLQTMKNANPCLTRWALAIQPFIVHRPGCLHSNADGLSRQS